MEICYKNIINIISSEKQGIKVKQDLKEIQKKIKELIG